MKGLKHISLRYSLMVLVLGVVGLYSCNEESESLLEKEMREDNQEIVDYLAANQIEEKKTVAGIYYQPVVENTTGDRPGSDEIVSIYYKIKTLDGKHIDSLTQNMGAPARFRRGYQNVFPLGIDDAMSVMRQGETYRFFIPSYFGYWDISTQKIPSYTPLIAELTVAGIYDENTQKTYEQEVISDLIEEKEWGEMVQSFTSGLKIVVTQEGTGDKPQVGETVKIKYVGKLLNGTIFDQTEGAQTFNYTIGATNIIKGWQEGIPKLKKGSKATLILPSHLAYGFERALVIPREIASSKIGSLETLLFEVEVLNN